MSEHRLAEMKKFHNLILASIFLLAIIILTTGIGISAGQNTQESYHLIMDMAIYIEDIFMENSTAKVEVNLWIRNFPVEASNVYVLFQNVNFDKIDLRRVGGTEGQYQFQGKIENKSWYLEGYGELFPFDFYTLVFELHPYYLEYNLNGTQYGLPGWNYTFQEQTYADFLGLNRPRLRDQWEIAQDLKGEAFNAYLFRKNEMPSFQFVFPLVLIHALVVFSSSFTEDKSLRIRLYGSILVFSPIFIFAIQNFIPHRSTLSIPEFLGIALIFSSTSMIFASLIESRSKRISLFLDIAGILFSFFFYAWLRSWVYADVESLLLLPHVKPWFDLMLLLFIAGVIARLIMSYRVIASLFHVNKEKIEEETEKENEQKEHVIPERTYLLVLVIAFIGLALGIWFWLIPYGVLEYNFGVNLVTSSIFMVLTIIFLMWLFNLRDKIQWTNVRQKVYSRIAMNLRSIISLITYFVEMKDMKRMDESKQSCDIKEIMLARLEDLYHKESIILDKKGKSILLDKDFQIDIDVRRRHLSEIEMKYSRFLNPELVSSLIEIENCLFDLKLHITNLRYPPSKYDGFEDVMFDHIADKFQKILKEIYSLQKTGITIYSSKTDSCLNHKYSE